ncbi:hypothetical protein D5018_05410 [Parashewanella curva]|uniref:Uncharacterized protein n=1 Tax=Parashewanella curva TaxID=2338552 RepID=A0A3L8Q2N1_9GAMM|nr:hypothetical protein [Parashewanella curva]RLV60712.1 hypothetical protein D5018_05410 [Parashewanella curva]
MNHHRGMSNSKILVLVAGIVLILLILLVTVNQEKKMEALKANHQHALTDIVVAIKHVNEVVLGPEPTGNFGIHHDYFGDVSLDLVNGKLRATTSSLENGLDIARKLLVLPHIKKIDWQMIPSKTASLGAHQIKLIPRGAGANCYLLYTEAGTSSHPRAPQYIIVNNGC